MNSRKVIFAVMVIIGIALVAAWLTPIVTMTAEVHLTALLAIAVSCFSVGINIGYLLGR